MPTITAGVALTNALFQGEKLSGAQVFEGAAAGDEARVVRAQRGEEARDPDRGDEDARARPRTSSAWSRARDPVLKNEYVVICAHLDHTGLAARRDAAGDTVINGADDDGSGSVAADGHRARLRAGRGEGHPAEALHDLPLGGRRGEGPLGLAVLRPVPAGRHHEGRGQPEHGHDRPQQAAGLRRPAVVQAGRARRSLRRRPEHQQRRHGRRSSIGWPPRSAS